MIAKMIKNQVLRVVIDLEVIDLTDLQIEVNMTSLLLLLLLRIMMRDPAQQNRIFWMIPQLHNHVGVI